jgi:glycosyltransferase involved in cell wall biosynthesis
MNIVMVAGHCCIRVQKMAIPLIEKGHDVHLIGSKVPSFHEQYKSFSLCCDPEQYIEAIKLHVLAGKVDVFHCHNEPSWFVTAIKEMCDVPVILDVHDSFLTRSTPEQAVKALDAGEKHVRICVEERNNFQLADGLVFPGEDFRGKVVSEFGLKQPALTLPSYVPKRFYQYSHADWHGGLVYEGKVNLPEETKGYNSGFNYCDYTDVATRSSQIGLDFHLYAGRQDEKFRKHYAEKAFIHKPLDYTELMSRIGRHDWGLVGNSVKTEQWKAAMPNKLFEYVAAGMPVVSMNADHCSRFLEETGMGISVGGPEELAERWAEHRPTRAKVVKERQAWSMNAKIHELEGFYRAFSA